MLMFRRAIRRSCIRRLVVWSGLLLSVTVLSQAGDAPERSNGERTRMATNAAGGVRSTLSATSGVIGISWEGR